MKMLKILLIIFGILLSPFIFSQVGINEDGTPSHPSAMFDINSSNSGLLLPRLTKTERNSIPSPATGLLIYNTTSNLFNYFNGSFWCRIDATFITFNTGIIHSGTGISISAEPDATPDSSAMLDVADHGKGVLIPRTTPASVTSPVAGLIIYNTSTNRLNYYNGSQWVGLIGISTGVTGAAGSQESYGIAINSSGSLPHQSAILDVSASDKGMLIPRLNNNQRDSIVAVTGLTIYNTTTNAIQYYNGSGWYELNNSFIAAPVAGVHVSSSTQIIWNWNSVTGATGYKWNTTDNYATAIDMGTSTSKTETGLTPDSAYTRYVYSYKTGANSTATTMTDTTTLCTWTCGQPITDSRDGNAYNTVQINHPLGAQFGKQCWIKENLNIGSRIDGIENQTNNGVIEKYCYRDSTVNCDIYGGLYQWRELMNYKTSLDSMTFGKKQGICPTGWHVPSDAELTQMTSWLGEDNVVGGKMKEAGYAHWLPPNTGATNSSGFTGLPGGWRNEAQVFERRNTDAHFWSSSWSAYPDTNFLWTRQLQFSYENIYRTGNLNIQGLSVRCILDTNAMGSFSCGDSIIIEHIAGTVAPVTKTVTYGTVSGIPGEPCKCWITSNLGADHQADSVNDATEPSAGWYWQFDQKQGYKHDGTTRTPNTWVGYIGENSDWLSANDPCALLLGTGWRLPTFTEWYNADNIGNWTNSPWNSALKMHNAGRLWYGSLDDTRGTYGVQWSSTQATWATGWSLAYSWGMCEMIHNYNEKEYGYSSRCLRD